MAADVLEGLASLDQKQNANPFWVERVEASDLGHRRRRLKGQSNRDDPHIAEALGVVDEVRGRSKELGRLAASVGKDDLPRHFLHLHAIGKLRAFFDFLDERKLALNSTAIRWFLYAERIAGLAQDHVDGAPRILEIGAGGGEMAYFVHEMRPWSRYVVVDLPPMLANLCRNLAAKIPDAEFALNEWPAPSNAPQIVMLDPEHTDLIPSGSVDFGLNFNSFMEMDEGVRDEYIALIYRALRSGGIFYNCNRRQPEMTRADGSTFDNHPLLYPYRSDDTVLEWDQDLAQMAPRTGFCAPFHRIAVSRIALVA